jgi:DNA replication protein DnaC
MSSSAGRMRETQKILDRIEKRVKWVACSNCKDEWSKVFESGLCPTCDDVFKRTDEDKETLGRMIGPWAVDRFTLDGFNVDSPARAHLKSIAVKFRPKTDNLYIFGNVRSGKTHIAAAILQEWFSALNGHVGFFKTRTLSRIVSGLRGFDQEDYINGIASRRLLVIDDVGLEKSSEHMLGVIYDILEYRITRGISGLIVTSNLSIDAMSEKFGDSRLGSRLNGICQVVQMDDSFVAHERRDFFD